MLVFGIQLVDMAGGYTTSSGATSLRLMRRLGAAVDVWSDPLEAGALHLVE
jgi:hypothetical protein